MVALSHQHVTLVVSTLSYEIKKKMLLRSYPDEILSTKIIGERQFEKAVELFTSASDEVAGKIDFRQLYVNFTDVEVVLDDKRVVRTCPAALGPGFAAGTTDGPGAFGFQQGDTEVRDHELINF